MSSVLTETPETSSAEPTADAGRWLRPPTFEEVHTEWMRYWATPIEILDPGCRHAGQFVAFFDGKPWGYDPDPTALRERVHASLDAHPNWVQIAFLG